MLPVVIFLLISSAICAEYREVDLVEDDVPNGAVLLIVDGLGSSYIYPEHRPYSLEGRPLEHSLLFNLTDGARVLDVRAPVPATLPGHSVIVTGYELADDTSVGMNGSTVFDAARDNGYLCLAILQRGDFMNMLLKQDCVLYFENNTISGEPIMGCRSGVPDDVSEIMEEWMHAYSFYRGSSYARYNRWGLDAAADIVRRMERPFLLVVNLGGIDSAAHYRGFEEYTRAVNALDVGLGVLVDACKEKGVLLMVTADHGMSFSRSRGGHSGESYSSRLESLRIPLVAIGPGVDDIIVGGRWSQAGIAPTLLSLLGIEYDLPMSEDMSIPIKKRYSLQITLPRAGDVELYRDESILAAESGSSTYIFKGLSRGLYELAINGERRPLVLLNDITLDLRESRSGFIPRWLIGAVLILAINICGIAVILRIIRSHS